MRLKKITLELSLKPFYDLSDAAIEEVFVHLFDQWRAMLDDADEVAIMYWAADGSEILDYRGNLSDPFEWGKYMGGANPRSWDKEADPDRVGLHSRWYLYRDNPPEMTYGDFARINRIAKAVGTRMTGKPVTLTATFDPGPEFAVSPFKYERHTEILRGLAMGKNSFVCCYGVLNGDDVSYAAYPNGIPDGTPFGTFFGKQCQCFLTDLGFDAIWFSNGFGFGTESWGVTGAIFDGEQFDLTKIPETEQRIMEFWRLFRAECPDFRIETRGTNLMVGIDYSTDAVNTKKLYESGLNLLPPPNSPWAALDGDFGLEIAGYLSRIAELPEDEYLFRFYTHDPWWVNSPWIDRYEGQPHDIYLPLAVGRLNEKGGVCPPTHLSFLSADTTYGTLPDEVPQQCIPHLRRGFAEFPDEASPVVWVYPFAEYQQSDAPGYSATKPFFEDWYMRSAMGAGLPVATVVSTDTLASILDNNPKAVCGRILVTPYPTPDSPWEKAVLRHVNDGGQLLVYGRALPGKLARRLGLTFGEPLDGELEMYAYYDPDGFEQGELSGKIYHNPIISDGGIDVTDAAYPLATVMRGHQARVYAARSGSIVWVRGTNSAHFRAGSHLLVPHKPSEYYNTGRLLRYALDEFGISIRFDTVDVDCKLPVALFHRHEHAVYASVYNPNTTSALRMSTPFGAPALMGFEAKLQNGEAIYHLPRAARCEIRAFVRQDSGVISCREDIPVSAQIDRRWRLEGLQNADVYWLEQDQENEILLNSRYPHVVGEPITLTREQTPLGEMVCAHSITGTLEIGRKRRAEH